jgi:hypothetical protein
LSKVLDIGWTFNMIGGVGDTIPVLLPEVLEWCITVLGYIPKLDYEFSNDQYMYKFVHIVFRHESDPLLFRINFAHKWEPFNEREAP